MYTTEVAGVTLNSSFVESNSARLGGGAFVVGNSAVAVYGSAFQNNTAARSGGAVFSNAAASFATRDCVFALNQAQSGGAVFLDGVQPWRFENTNFTKNQALASGGALRFQTGSVVHISHCTFDSNTVRGRHDARWTLWVHCDGGCACVPGGTTWWCHQLWR